MKVAGDYQIVADAANSVDGNGRPRGNMLRLWAAGKAQRTDSGGSLFWRHIDPSWMLAPDQTVPAPCAIQVDVYAPGGFRTGIGLLSVHRLNKRTGDWISVAGYELYPRDRLVLIVRDGEGNDQRVTLASDLYRLDEWNTIRLVFLPDGGVIPEVNGQNAYARAGDLLKVPVDRDHDAGFINGHAGLISANETEDDGLDGMWILNDNFMVMEYQ